MNKSVRDALKQLERGDGFHWDINGPIYEGEQLSAQITLMKNQKTVGVGAVIGSISKCYAAERVFLDRVERERLVKQLCEACNKWIRRNGPFPRGSKTFFFDGAASFRRVPAEFGVIVALMIERCWRKCAKNLPIKVKRHGKR